MLNGYEWLSDIFGPTPFCWRSSRYSLAGECLAQLGDGFPRSVSVSSSTQLLVGCGIDGQLQLLSAVSRRVIANFSHAKSECDKAEVSFWEEDFEMNEPGGLRYRRLQDFPSLDERLGPDILDADGIPRQGITSAQWSPDERYLATKHESFPSVVWIWDLGRMALKSLLKHQSTVKCMAWDPAARGELSRLALSTSDPVLFFWSPGQAEALPCALSAARLRWRADGRSLLLQERDRCCACRLGSAARKLPRPCRVRRPAWRHTEASSVTHLLRGACLGMLGHLTDLALKNYLVEWLVMVRLVDEHQQQRGLFSRKLASASWSYSCFGKLLAGGWNRSLSELSTARPLPLRWFRFGILIAFVLIASGRASQQF
ncbi:unnamed protein product [Durusdinium trenchii]|uniref:Uncharacterized protein n=2 Tax=Durusdinium trenchii TaxID=1381693 RepID=A0ABP0JNP1_9DINO